VNRRELLILGGAAVTRPFAARAQQPTMPVIGVLVAASPGGGLYEARLAALRQGLSETGYVEGQNLAIEYRWAESHYDRMPALAADLVGRTVDLIVTFDTPSARAAKSATSTIPIVFFMGSDPVELGLVVSLARPGGNLTGVTYIGFDLLPKRLDLLCQLVPQASTVGYLVNPRAATAERAISAMQDAARAKGVQVSILKGATEGEIDDAFATLANLKAGALVVGDDPFYNNRRDQLLALASRYAIPAIYGYREVAVAGGLISYGVSLPAAHRQMGVYAGRILKGEKPADLPVQQPNVFELVINLKTAKALGLTVPQTLLGRADEVIE
jgi:putative ABC transport system substrate-binding protein